MKTLCIIPCRKGSKRLPGKNTRRFNGVPLITRKVTQALRSCLFTDVVVSTDDPEVIRLATSAGAKVPFIRPDYLAKDTTATEEVVEHALEALSHKEYQYVVVMQVTSPCFKDEDLSRCMEWMYSNDSAYSVNRDWDLNGAFYGIRIACYRDTLKPDEAIRIPCDAGPDIDTEEDFIEAERIARRGKITHRYD